MKYSTSTRTIRYVVLGSFILGNAAVIALSIKSINEGKRLADQRAQVEVQSVVRAVATNLEETIERIANSIQTASQTIQRGRGRRLTDQQIAELVNTLEVQAPEIRTFRVVDDDGNEILFKQLQHGTPVKWSQEPDTRVLITDHDHKTTIWHTILPSGTSEQETEKHLLFARQIETPTGQMAGVATAIVPIANIRKSLMRFAMSQNTAISLIDNRREELIRYQGPGENRKPTSTDQWPELEGRLELGEKSGTYQAVSSQDGTESVYSFEALQKTDLIVRATQSSEQYLSEWKWRRGKTITIAFLFGLVSILSSFVLLRLLRMAGKQQDELATATDNFNEAQKIALIGSYEWNPVNKTLTWSDQYFRLWGYEPGEIQPSKELFEAGIHDADRSRVLAAIETAISNGGEYQVMFRLAPKADRPEKYVNARGSAMTGQSGQTVKMIGTIQDITKSMYEQIQLQRSETMYRTLYEDTADAVILLEAGVITDCNQAAVNMFGASSKTVLQGQRITDLSPSTQEGGVDTYSMVALLREETIKNGTSRFEWTHQRRDDAEIFPCEVRLSAVTINGKSVLQAVMRDITVRKQVEQQLVDINETLERSFKRRTDELAAAMRAIQHTREELVRSEAKATLSTMVASVTHEFSSPLGNAMIVSGTIKDRTAKIQSAIDAGTSTDAMIESYVKTQGHAGDILTRNLNRARNLLDSFRQVAADQASEQRRRFSLNQVVNELLETLSPTIKRYPQQVEVDIAPTILMDSLPGPIGQVVINIVNNAFLHGFEGRTNGTLKISATQTEEEVTIVFQDDGAGISEANLKHMFEPFFSTKIGKGGTGLGMAIVRNLVQKTLNGRVTLESELGAGTTISVVLPRVAPEAIEDKNIEH